MDNGTCTFVFPARRPLDWTKTKTETKYQHDNMLQEPESIKESFFGIIFFLIVIYFILKNI
jgi:hypothetical protein